MTITAAAPLTARRGARANGVGRAYIIHGGRPLRGEIAARGAKNAALPILAATLLTADRCRIENVPDFRDIHTMLDVLRHLGAEVEFDVSRGRVDVCSRDISSRTTPVDLASRLRGSFLVMGPLLARFGEASAPQPGGCAIGSRPVDVHSQGFRCLGAEVACVDQRFAASGRLQGASFILDYPSHTGTENVVMAAVLADGISVIDNASIEPEVLDLVACLRSMGARIAWTGPAQLTIQGVPRLHGTVYRLMPDRLETGTYLLAAAVTRGDVTVTRAVPEHLRALTAKLSEAGVIVETGPNSLRARADGHGALRSVAVRTFPYPGFPTDLQQCFATFLTQAEGESSVHETIFEDRLRYVEELKRMGARIRINGQTAVITGPTRLVGAEVTALDLRAGAAVVLAGLAATGTTVVHEAQHVERGYADLLARLTELGADCREAPDQPSEVAAVRSRPEEPALI